MSFMHVGLAVAGLLSVSIPIIIHLLMRRRRKPVMWGAMRFLVEAYKRQRRRLLIERWLLLATRCLLLALLALALGRPLLGALAGGSTGRTIILLIDNGVAAQTLGPDGRTALERHLADARDAVRELENLGGEQSRVGIVTLAGPAQGILLPPSADLGAVEAILNQIEPTDARTDIPGALELVAASTSAGDDDEETPDLGRVVTMLLSDLRVGSADTNDRLPDLPAGARLVASRPASDPIANVTITDVQPLRSVVVTGESGEGIGNEQVRVRLRRSGAGLDQATTSTVSVRVLAPNGPGNEQRATVRWSPGQDIATTSLQLGGRETGGAGGNDQRSSSAVILASLDGDALGADNQWRRPVELRRALRIGVASPRTFGRRQRIDELQTGAWMRLALRPDISAGIDIVEMEPAALDQAQLAGLDGLVVTRPDLVSRDLWTRLRLFLDRGGLLLVVPPSDATVHLWTDAMLETLDLPWTIERETRRYPDDSPAQLAEFVDDPNEPDGLLSNIEGEVADLGLARAVSVFQVLPSIGNDDAPAPLLALDDGTSLIRAARPGENGRGLVILLASSLELGWTDLPTKPLMVPLAQEIFRQGIGRARGSWQAVAGERPNLPARTVELRPSDWANDDGASPDIIRTDEAGLRPLQRAGVWDAIDDRDARRGVIALNADPAGTDLANQPDDLLTTWLTGALDDPETGVTWVDEATATESGVRTTVRAVLGDDDNGSPISLPLLIAALVLAAFELVLARLSSHATIGDTRVRTGTPVTASGAAA